MKLLNKLWAWIKFLFVGEADVVQEIIIINTMNLNEFAKKITLQEGLKKNTNIAQVKEVLRIVLKLMKDMSVEEIAALLKRVR